MAKWMLHISTAIYGVCAPIFMPSPALSVSTGSISGHVFGAESGVGVGGVTVFIEEINRIQISDSQGYYSFLQVHPGTYIIRSHRIGYQENRFEVHVSAGSITHCDLEIVERPLETPTTVVVGQNASSALQKPKNIIIGSKLSRNLNGTIAETIDYEAGITTRSMGPAASRPIIRGIGGERLVIVQDGQKTGDLSASSADHAVAIEPLNVERIEIIRGPQALLYSSNVLGGVINVLKHAVPYRSSDNFLGSFSSQFESVSKGKSSALLLIRQLKSMTLRFDGAVRGNGDMSTPIGSVDNTDIHTGNTAFGISSNHPWGNFGLSGGLYTSNYGVPADPLEGHALGVAIDLQRQYFELRGNLLEASSLINSVEISQTFSRYQHKEYESDDYVGVEFGIISQNTNILARLDNLGPFENGAIGFSYSFQDHVSKGLTYTPPTKEYTGGIFAYQEWVASNISINAGMRVDHNLLKPRKRTVSLRQERTFSGLSSALSASYQSIEELTLGLTIARTFRAPSIEELYSDGPHLAVHSYEVGNDSLGSEIGTGLEGFLDYHHDRGNIHLSIYRNFIEGYIFPTNTGLSSLRRADLLLYRMTGERVLMYGAEAAVDWSLPRNLNLDATVSHVRGYLTEYSNQPLPLIPPIQARVNIGYEHSNSAKTTIGVRMATKQTQTAEFESPTDGYAVLDLSGQYHLHWQRYLHAVSLKIENIANTVYRKHLNRVKEIMPQPGRNVGLAYKVYF